MPNLMISKLNHLNDLELGTFESPLSGFDFTARCKKKKRILDSLNPILNQLDVAKAETLRQI